MSTKLPIESAIASAVAVADAINLSRVYNLMNVKEIPVFAYSHSIDENLCVAEAGMEFEKSDATGSFAITPDKWRISKLLLQKVMSSAAIEKVDSWLSMKMLEGKELLMLHFHRVHTVLDGKSEYIIMPILTDRDGKDIQENRRVLIEEINHLDLNATLQMETHYHAAIEKLTETLKRNFFESSYTSGLSVSKKRCTNHTDNIYGVTCGDFIFKVEVKHDCSELTQDLNAIATLSRNYSLSEQLNSEKFNSVTKAPETTKIEIAKVSERSIIDDAIVSIAVNGRAFEFGSF
ncbi:MULTISPECIES: hypothetical protein [Xenorhabdus]|uniref:hypothetical protein n=1 Tax=Xenorhabdus TaxID=626 RepID=UPI00064A19F1|nr:MULTISPECIES: hypothetical protein [Xenorhabdus]KLU17103.1 hypothetical protein AAY47_01375 [Xenorhabdus griffiniae]KOP31702.1 hypothetical protein AFK69_19625 [Xenorhabdus sp. GDc328]